MGVGVAPMNGGYNRLAGCGEKGEGATGDKRVWDAPNNGPALGTTLQECVRDHERREAGVPEHVEPRRTLGSGDEESRWREASRKSHRMGNGGECGEEVSARQDQERPRAEEVELPEKERRRDEIDHDKRRLVERDERRNRYEGRLGEWRRRKKCSGQDQDDPRSETSLPRRRGH